MHNTGPLAYSGLALVCRDGDWRVMGDMQY